MPKVSIIIPAYNLENYIEKCVDSLKEQSFRDFEALIINDGSSDNTAKICEKIAKEDSRFRLINQKNGGVSSARNHGLREAVGKYIAFIDGDDLVGRLYLEYLVAAGEKHDADIVVSPIVKITEQMGPEVISDEQITVSSEEAALNLLYGKNDAYWGGPGAKLYRRAFIKDKYYREDLRYSEDVDYFYKAIMRAKKIVATKYAGYMYRIRPGSATQRGFNPAFMEYRVEMAKEDKRGLTSALQQAWRSNIAFNMIYYLSVMDKKKDKEYWDTAMRYLKEYRKSAIKDKNQKWDQKLTILGSYISGDFAAWGLRKMRDFRIRKAH